MKNIFNKLTNTKQKKIIFSIISVFLIILICFSLSKTNFVRNLLKLAGIYTQEEKVIEFYSDGWEENEPGSIHVTKSADWIAEDTAEITFDIESKIKTDVENVDVILAIATTGNFKTSVNELANSILGNKNNNMALISFNNSSSILTGFTDDKKIIEEQLNNLTFSGESNYYLALKDVERLLSTYTKEDDREVIVLLLVNSASSSSKAYAQYDVIKEKYSYVTINGVSCGNSSYIINDLKKTTDNQYTATSENLSVVLSEASLNPEHYESFVLSDYIDADFFIENEDAIEVPFGNVELTDEDGTQKVTWTIPENSYSSGNKTSMSIKVKLDSKYANTENYYATNDKESIVYNFKDEQSITANSIATPVLKNGYKVVYDANPPAGCNITSLEAETHNAFNNVTISSEKPICDGFVFAGWKITTDNVDVINENEFIMPTSNVDIKGTWKKLSISKSMEGTIYLRPTYYNIMKSQTLGTDTANNIDFSANSSDTNGKGVYTLSGTENDEYPIYYYRGAVTNNNVLFANFCWKMVRTTETGGVKLIYNGVPAGGSCNNTGDASQLVETSRFNLNYDSAANVGYMYGNVYTRSSKTMTWHNIYLGRSTNSKSGMASTNYIYGKSISYSSSTGYSIDDGANYLWDDNYSNLVGYYTCLSEEFGACSQIYFITSAGSSYMYYVNLTNGSTYEEAVKYLNANPYVYGNDVIYENGTYTLQTTSSMSVMEWEASYENLSSSHYTCFSTSSSCSTVYFIYYADIDVVNYISLTDGKTIEEALEEMTSGSTNTTSSTIKTVIDTWYGANMTDYTKYLEDTVWCNDRSIHDLGGWSKNGTITNYMHYGPFGRIYNFNPLGETNDTYKPSLECKNEVDQFSMSNEKAKLTYPVGLLTADEVNLAGSFTYANTNKNYYLYTGKNYWLISPAFIAYFNYHNYGPSVFYIHYEGGLWPRDVFGNGYYLGVRPSVSLAPGIMYTDGDGSAETPYIVDDGFDYIGYYTKYDILFSSDEYQASHTKASQNTIIKISSTNNNRIITSFKMNGELVEGDSFIMPAADVTITDITFKEGSIIESEHNPYPNSVASVVYGEKTFSGATSLNVELDYQTESTSYDWIYLYDADGTAYGKYGGSTRTTKTITIPGEYIKIIFKTDGSGNNYYGFKATITPNY